MRKIIPLFIVCLILFAFTKQQRFNAVVNKFNDKEIRAKLRAYEKGGFEKKVPQAKVQYEKIIQRAKSFLGTPHKMGGLSKTGIDCSGLIKMSVKSCGIDLPHGSQPQSRFGKIVVTQKGLQRGDILYFMNTYETSKLVTHAGIYLGKGRMIHTSSSKGVQITGIYEKYWRGKFLFGTRLKADY